MHGSRHQIDADALLAHGEFVRGLARRLVFDGDRVDDVVQETWLAALENAPDRPRSLRAWLARVVRNVAFKAARAETRRRRREGLAPEPRPPEPPPDAVDRLARGRQVVDAVLELDEPYRTTVVLRFYEDLEPSEIARRLGINGATVRTRLRRGLEMLRARLDREAGGRRAWCLALLPVLVPQKGHVTGGIVIMSTKSKLSIAAVLLLAAAAGLLALWRSGSVGHAARRAPSTASAPAAAAGSEGASGADARREPWEGALRMVVRVEDGAGHPLPGARVEAYRSWFLEMGISFSGEDVFFAGATPQRPVATATTDATGTAVFRHEPRLAFVYRATKEGYARADSDRIEMRGEVDPEPVTLRLGPAYLLSGSVLDEDGRPIADAPVLAAEPAYGNAVPEQRIPARTVSAADGSYRFDDLPPRDVTVWAALPGGVPWHIATLRFPHVDRFDIVLERGGALSGTVTDADNGELLAGVRVRVMGYFQHRAEVLTDAEGRYDVRSLPGTVLSTIRLQKEGYYQVFEPGARDQIGVRLGHGDAIRIDARMRRAPVLRGTVRGPDGPLSDTKLQVSNWWTPGVGTFETRTDTEGRYSVAAAPGRFVVLIASRDLRIPGALDWSVRPENAKGDEGNVVELPERGEVVRDFTLEVGSELIEVRGTVTDREGRPIEGARIGEELSAADGSFRARGTRGFPVWAIKRGYSPGKSEPIEPGRDVRIVLETASALSGSITARDGAVVEGAYVLVAPEPPEGPDRATSLDRLWLDATRVAASGGRYEVRDLQPGKLLVRAGGGRYALSMPEAVMLEAGGEHVLDFVLEMGEVVRGRVVEAGTGAPVRSAWVHAQPVDPVLRAPDTATGSASRAVVVAVTGDDGRFAIENVARGDYEIVAEARGYLDGSVQAVAGGAAASVELEPALEIRGVAVFPDGRPAAGVGVFAQRDGGTPRERRYAPATGPNGRFVVPGLARGIYRVTVGGFGARPCTSDPVDAGASDLRLVVETAEPGEAEGYPEVQEGNSTLEGRIVNAAGEGIGGVRVYASPMKARRELLGRMAQSRTDGRFAIRGLAAEPHRVRAAFGEGEGGWCWQMKEDVTPGDAPSFVFLSLSGTIVGADLDGRELLARSLGTRAHSGDDGGSRAAVLDRSGAFRVDGLSPGRYRLSLRAVKDRPHMLLEGGEDVEAGRRDLVLRATKGASITGIVVDESGRRLAGLPVRASRDTEGVSTRADENGRFELTGLEPGATYLLWAAVDGKVPAEMCVKAPAFDVRVTIEKGFEASGRVLNAEGRPVPDTQIRLVAVGHDAPLRSAQTDSVGRFTVTGLRDGEYRVEMRPKVAPAPEEAERPWRPIGTIRARDRDVEIRAK